MAVYQCVRRLETGRIAYFRDGSPPGGRMGLEAYCRLSGQDPRFVAGITTSLGEALLVAGGHVRAVYRNREWSYYDWRGAMGVLATKAAESCGVEERHLQGLLNVVERLGHLYRKGAMFVLTDIDIERNANYNETIDRYFVRMIETADAGVQDHTSRRRLMGNGEDVNWIVSRAQMDGCCVIAKDGGLLGYGLKVSVSPEQIEGTPEERRSILKKLRRTLREPGTRRWSAALLSLVQPRWLIVNVSADGPVKIFHNGAITKLFGADE